MVGAGDASTDGTVDSGPEASKTIAARQSERARCAKIFSYGIKHGCINSAIVLAFETDMTASKAITVLQSARQVGACAGIKGGREISHQTRTDITAAHIIASGQMRRGEQFNLH